MFTKDKYTVFEQKSKKKYYIKTHRPFQCFAPQRPAYYWVQPVSRVDIGKTVQDTGVAVASNLNTCLL